jgi:DNA-binding NarL/FixJ family response regulator
LVAPIALYPDSLLAQIFMASTYPLEVVQAGRWAKANQSLKGDALTAALEKENWDPSVKSLVDSLKAGDTKTLSAIFGPGSEDLISFGDPVADNAEREVSGLVVSGILNKQVAFDLGTAEKTIKVHRARVMKKTGAQSLADLVRFVEKLGIRFSAD